jgi:hypothetical protein
MGMIMDESVSLDRLRAFPVVYVPNAAVLTAKEADLFETYVSGGGRLLVTGLTGVCDSFGQVQTKSVVSTLIGARLVQCHTGHPDNYVRLPGGLEKGDGSFLLKGIPPDWPMLTWGPLAAYEPNGARSFGELMVAHRSRDNQWSGHMSPDKVVGPAVLIHRLGAGEVICVPCALDAAYVGDFRMPEHRTLIANLIRHLNPKPSVTVRAPLNVEIVVSRDEARQRLLVHLICFAGSVTSAAVAFPKGTRVLPPVMAEPMDYRARVHVREPFAKAEVAGPETDISVNGNDVDLQISTPHEVLSIYA